MENVTLTVEGMSCGHCVKAVETSVGSLQGIDSVNVQLEGGQVAVAFDQNEVSVEDIKNTIEDQGYDVV